MSSLGCCVWWLVLGILLGWLLNWLLSKLLRKDPPADTNGRSSYRTGSASSYSGTAQTDTTVGTPPARHDDALRSDFSARPATDSVQRPATDASHLQQSIAPAIATGAAIDLVAARGFGFTIEHAEDLAVVEGIGPKIAELFRANGITTFAELANTSVERMRQILDNGGPRYRIANPGTWAQQAGLAAQNRWAELKALQDRLDAGVAQSNDL